MGDAVAPPLEGNNPPAVRSEHTGAFVRLAQLWRHRSHFSLVFAVADNPAYRDALIARLDAIGSATRIDLGDDDAAATWLRGAEQASANGAGRLHLCLPLDRPRADAWWQQANVLRERLADALPGLQVVWLSNTDADLAAHGAPDLWNWRESVLSFGADVLLHAPQVQGAALNLATGAEAAAIRQRLAEIERHLATREDQSPASGYLRAEAARGYERLGDWARSIASAASAAAVHTASGDASAAASAKLTMAMVLHQRGQPDEALQLLVDEVEPVFQKLGDVHATAVTMGKIADILHARGQLDEALRIRQEEELPVFQRLGDVRSTAVTMGQIADILHARGQLDEALRIRQEEQLPVFQRLGDVRSTAVTMGQIADILHARGQLDEALRIRQEEQLPVFQRLGDVRSTAVTMGQIADILHARGQLDEALRLHEDRASTFTALGDSGGLAHVQFSVARLMLERGDHDRGGLQEIHDRLSQAFGISLDSGQVDAIGAIGSLLAQIMAMKGLIDEARGVLAHAESAYSTLDDAPGLSRVRQLRQAFEAQRPGTSAEEISPQ